MVKSQVQISSSQKSRTTSNVEPEATVSTIIPPAIVLGAGGKWLLLVFGSNYSDKAWPALAVLALSAPAVAAYGWTVTLLKATGQLKVMIATNVVYAVVTIGLTAGLASKGLVWVAVAWLAGNAVAGICGGLALMRHRTTSEAHA